MKNRIIIYAGQYYDSETGLHYNYHRYYDPKLGRYLRADPIGLAGGVNLYTYVQNNPVNFYDPLGLVDINYHDPKTDHYIAHKHYTSPKGYFTVGGHGTPSLMEDNRTGKTVVLKPSDIVKAVLAHPNFKGQDVKLMSCNTGKGEDSFAQLVADEFKKNDYDITVYGANNNHIFTTTSIFGIVLKVESSVQDEGKFIPFKGR
mgnify:CR=1 FL=1